MKPLTLVCLLLLFSLSGYSQDFERYAILIHEIFPDPTPSRGLPESEFIELRNVGRLPVNLRNWSLSNGSTTGRITADHLLLPDSIVILCSSGAVGLFRPFGTAISLTPFPTLNNDGDTLELRSPQSRVIHAITWNRDLYGNALKSSGGFTLEMKDISKPCLTENNWSGAASANGGTPGKKNSITTAISDTAAPKIITSYMKDSVTLVIVFNEPLPSLNKNGINISGKAPLTAELMPPLYNTANIMLQNALPGNAIIDIQLSDVGDCASNRSPQLITRTGRFSAPAAQDLVINEILFDPPPGGSDYLEVYNRSGKVIDLGRIYLSGRTGSNGLTTPIKTSITPEPLMPGAYKVITEDRNWLIQKFRVLPELVMHSALPTLPDDEGTIVLLGETGNVIDEVRYNKNWHHPLIADRRGIALERISAEGPSQDRQNWHSASTLISNGTPGMANSQASGNAPDTGVLSISTGIITPDPDGRDDYLILYYRFENQGYIANITIHDLQGRIVRQLANNELCGTSGKFTWDGLGNGQQPLVTGHYIINATFFSLYRKSYILRRAISLRQNR